MIAHGCKFVGVALVAVFTSTPAFADDVMYWITCDCQPNNQADAEEAISTEVSAYTGYGGSQGFEVGDVVVIQNSSASPTHGRWTYQANGTWTDTSSEGFQCSGFDACVDLTGGTLPQPPFEVPTTPQQPNTVAANYNGCSGPNTVYGTSWSSVASATYYEVYRSYNLQTWVLMGQTGGTSLSINGCFDGYVRVRACNGLFGCGNYSSMASIYDMCQPEHNH